MSRLRNKLNVRMLENLGIGRHSDGGGLYLRIGEANRSSWLYLFRRDGKRREIGLGGYPAVSLREARLARDNVEQRLAAGKEPVAKTKKIRIKAPSRIPTFGQLADDVIATKTSDSRSAKHIYQWRQTLTGYAAPLCKMRVDEITTQDVLDVLKPLWGDKHETAKRLRGRIEAVLDAAKALRYLEGENPAVWKGNLAHLLPKPKKLTRGHQLAMPYAEVPEFMAQLQRREATAALALEFTILTAVRTSEALLAQFDEFDRDAGVWLIPKERTKTGKAHQVPLCPRALAIVQRLYKYRQSSYVFPNNSGKAPLSNMSMLMLLRRMEKDVTVHGFRSSFRDWAGDKTQYQREIVEEALSHLVGSDVERAYRRSDALEKRRALMNDWQNYCLSLVRTQDL